MAEEKDLQYVAEAIDMEGFDYALRHWSSFGEIKDEKFHELRQAYIDAANKLEAYVEAYSTPEGEDDEEDEDF